MIKDNYLIYTNLYIAIKLTQDIENINLFGNLTIKQERVKQMTKRNHFGDNHVRLHSALSYRPPAPQT